MNENWKPLCENKIASRSSTLFCREPLDAEAVFPPKNLGLASTSLNTHLMEISIGT